MPKKRIKNLFPSKVVALGREIISASYSLSVSEKTFLWLIIRKLDSRKEVKFLDGTVSQVQEIKSEDWFSLSVQEYADEAGIAYNSAKENLQIGTEALFANKIVLLGRNSNSFHQTRWISELKYDENTYTYSVRFAQGIIPYISQLSERYTMLNVYQSINLSSKYTWRIYDLLVENSFKGRIGHVEYSVSDLMDMFVVPDSFRKYSHFKKHVLQRAIQELKEKNYADVILKENPGREKRKIVSVIRLEYRLLNLKSGKFTKS